MPDNRLIVGLDVPDTAAAHALVEGLGDDYRERLAARHTDLDLSTPLRQLAMPFRVADQSIEIIRDLSYADDDGKRGRLDVYRPRRRTTAAPVLLGRVG